MFYTDDKTRSTFSIRVNREDRTAEWHSCVANNSISLILYQRRLFLTTSCNRIEDGQFITFCWRHTLHTHCYKSTTHWQITRAVPLHFTCNGTRHIDDWPT